METKEALKTVYVLSGGRNLTKVDIQEATYKQVDDVISTGYMMRVPADGTILNNGSTMDVKANDVVLTTYSQGGTTVINITNPEVTAYFEAEMEIINLRSKCMKVQEGSCVCSDTSLIAS